MKEKNKWLSPKLLVFVRGKENQEVSLYNCKGVPRYGDPNNAISACSGSYRYVDNTCARGPCSIISNS